MQPRIGYRVGCVLEGWNIDDNTDVPGEGLFYDTVYKSYGAPMSIDLEPWYSQDLRDHTILLGCRSFRILRGCAPYLQQMSMKQNSLSPFLLLLPASGAGASAPGTRRRKTSLADITAAKRLVRQHLRIGERFDVSAAEVIEILLTNRPRSCGGWQNNSIQPQRVWWT